MSDFGFSGGSTRFYSFSGTVNGGVSIPTGSGTAFGAWTQIVASTPFEATALFCQCLATGTSGGAAAGDFNIGVGAAGSEQIIIPDCMEFVAIDNDGISGNMRRYPVNIPAGSRIAAQVSTSNAGSGILYAGIECGSFLNPSIGGRVTSYGVTSPYGTSLGIPSAGSTGWTQITGATTNPIKQAVLNMQVNQSAHWAGTIDIAVGAAGSEQIIVPGISFWTRPQTSPNPFNFTPRTVDLPLQIPKGTRISYRINFLGGSGGGTCYVSLQGID